jgi:hypothetical protein
MPLDLSLTENMSPVDAPIPAEALPDLPEGEWDFVVKLVNKIGKPEKGSIPQFEVTFTAIEAFTPGNEAYRGAACREYMCCFPAAHKGYKMHSARFRALGEASEAGMPDTSSLANNPPSWDSLVPWVDAVESVQVHGWTKNDKDKEGNWQTKVVFQEPGKPLVVAPNAEEPEAEPVETKAATHKPATAYSKPASNGKANGHKNGKAKR